MSDELSSTQHTIIQTIHSSDKNYCTPHRNNDGRGEPADTDIPDTTGQMQEDIERRQPICALKKTYLQQQTWPFYRLRSSIRCCMAEFFGTMVLIIFGNGVVATAVFNGGELAAGQSNAGYLAITLGWGLGLAMALFISMGVSGGHLNPAVTFSSCLFKAFPWRKFPGYVLSQMLGAIVGAACVYALFKDQFDATEAKLAAGETMTQSVGGIFCTYPKGSNRWAAWSEFLNTMLLLMGIMGIVDERMTSAVNYKPIAIGLLVMTLGICSGWNSGYAINPARDLGPRMFSAMVFGKEPFTSHNYYFWIPMLVPFAGATAGMFLYAFFIIPKDV